MKDHQLANHSKNKVWDFDKHSVTQIGLEF